MLAMGEEKGSNGTTEDWRWTKSSGGLSLETSQWKFFSPNKAKADDEKLFSHCGSPYEEDRSIEQIHAGYHARSER